MTRPAETTPQDETRSAFCARCGYAWYIHGSFDFDDLCDAFVAKEPRVAVVRPTRSEIEELIATHIRAYACRERDAERLAVALLASFGVAVSDSQETPTKGRER